MKYFIDIINLLADNIYLNHNISTNVNLILIIFQMYVYKHVTFILILFDVYFLFYFIDVIGVSIYQKYRIIVYIKKTSI